jgi:hypothetical protein
MFNLKALILRPAPLKNLCHPPSSSEAGYTLTVILLFVIALAGILAAISRETDNAYSQKMGISTGQSLAEVARAARIYVRDGSRHLVGDPARQPLPDNTPAPGDNTFSDAFSRFRIAPAGMVNDVNQDSVVGDLSIGPIEFNIDDLIQHGFLPVGYGDNDTGVYRTPLGHQIRLYAANVPVADNPTVNGDVVASAYVFIQPAVANNVNEINDIIIGLRGEGVSVSAPLFNAAGANLTGTICRGTPAVAIWDTGCLNDADFQTLTGFADPDGGGPRTAFPPGGLIIPAWRAAQFDLRAVMRYPQPENPGYATMLTGLSMGEWDYERDAGGNIVYRNAADAVVPATDPNAVASCFRPVAGVSRNVFLNSDTGPDSVRTSVCLPLEDDNVANVDRRFDIRNVNAMEVGAFIVTPQNPGANDVVTYHDGANYVTVTRNDAIQVDLINNTTLAPGPDGIADPGGTHMANGGFYAKGNATVLNDVRVYNGGATLGDAVFGKNAVLNNTTINTTITELSTDHARAENYRQDALGVGNFDPNTIRLSSLRANGALNVTNNMTVEEINADSANINIDTATLSGNARVQNGVEVRAGGTTLPGGGAFKAAIANLDTASTVDIDGNLTIAPGGSPSNSAEFNGQTTVSNRLHVDGRCLGVDCPDRCPAPVSPLTGGTICP